MSLPLRSQIRTIASRRKCCALRARARVRERGRTLQAKEGNDALVSTERPTADHSTTRLADESTPPRRLSRLFSETSGLHPLGPRKTWARRGLYPIGKPRLAGNRTGRAHVALRSRGGPGAHPSPTPARSRTQAALGGLPANPYGSSPGPIKALGAGRSGTTKQSLFFMRNIFNGTFKGNARRIHEHCER